MNVPATCLLLTGDADLAARLVRTWPGNFGLRTVGSRAEDARWQDRTGPHVLLLDLRHAEAMAMLSDGTPEQRAACIALGMPGSDPFLAACAAGVFAAMPLDVPATDLLLQARRAAERLDLCEELRRLRQIIVPAAPDQPAAPAGVGSGPDVGPLQQFARASRHFQDADRLLDHVVEGMAASGQLVRVGVFTRRRDERVFRLQAGLRCLDATDTLTFDADAPLVRWIERHAYLVARVRLAHIADADERLLLLRTLDALGAEVLAPMLGQRGLLGWIFVGHRATGMPFTARDLADLSDMAEHVATLLDNALLYEDLARQRTLATNLVASLPEGIVAFSDDGMICEVNRAAEAILDCTAADLLHHPVETAGSRLADLARRLLAGETFPCPLIWTEPGTRRTLEATLHRIGPPAARLGGMLLLVDATRERLLRERNEEVDRHAFWTDLAAALAHEVRNPLVAISTFAQLLPERYSDPEFRQQFHAIVTADVQRLNGILTQIHTFAHPPPIVFHAVPLERLVAAARQAAQRMAPAAVATVEPTIAPHLPPIQADEDALSHALAHVLANACEALQGHAAPRVALDVRRVGAEGDPAIAFAISDNGPGIPDQLRDKLFSPFTTTKPRGLGLGLPIARRTVVDHGGRMDVVTSPQGTTVTITLPIGGRRGPHAENADC